MTTVLVAADGHYYRDASGAVYVDSVFDYNFYRRYLVAFDMVYALGRMTSVDEAPAGKRRADGPGVEFLDLEPGQGLKGYLRTGSENEKRVKGFVRKADCVIARIPGVVANMAVSACRAVGKAYSAEVVVDPWEYFAPETRGGLVNGAVRRVWTSGLKRSCREAVGVSYVTEHYLQERYPCAAMEGSEGSFTSHYSSVELPDDSFAEPRRHVKKHTLTLAHAANSFSGNSKGHYTLFDALEILVAQGYDVRAICVGDGPSLPDYRAYVEKAGLADRVEFTGRLSSGEEVRKRIAQADVFVFPTRAEGLPRVLLEAMAEGMPCLSTPVCGIPEILPEECLFAPDDAEGFAGGVAGFAEEPQLMDRASERNLAVAREYSQSKLGERRKAFYRQVAATAVPGVECGVSHG